MKRIKLTQGKFSIIDDEDFDRVSSLKWFCSKKGYAVRTNNKTRQCISMHRFILKLRPSKIQVDHINGDKLDNRKINLRLANNSQNAANRKLKPGKHGYRGVGFECSKFRYKPFYAKIRVNNKQYTKGMFRTIEEAALAYNELAIKHHGEFAMLNEVTSNKNNTRKIA